MFKRTILSALLLISTIAFGQTKYLKGNYVGNNGQVNNGLIKSEDWKTNPSEINFKSTEGAEAKTIKIRELKSFEIDGVAKYILANVNLETSTNNLNRLTFNNKPEYEKRNLLLNVLIDGQSSLLYYEGEGLKKYFIQENDIDIEPLIYIRYLKDGDLAANNRYKQQLSNSFASCSALESSDFANLTYTKSSLTKLFSKFNSCNGSTDFSDFTKSDQKIEFHIKAFAGLNSIKFDVTNSLTPRNGGDFGSAVRPRFGAELEVILPFNNGKWGAFTGVSKSVKFQETTTQETSSAINPIQDVIFTYNSLEIPMGVRHFMFINNDSKAYLQLGYFFDIVSDISIERSVTANDFQSSNGVTSGYFFLGGGYQYKQFFGDLRFDLGRDPLNEASFFYSAKTPSINFVVGYQFL